jgi:hypothetical protein
MNTKENYQLCCLLHQHPFCVQTDIKVKKCNTNSKGQMAIYWVHTVYIFSKPKILLLYREQYNNSTVTIMTMLLINAVQKMLKHC